MINPFIALQLFFASAQDRLEAIKNDEKGATAVEYALIVAAVAGVIAVAIAAFGDKVAELFNDLDPGTTTPAPGAGGGSGS